MIAGRMSDLGLMSVTYMARLPFVSQATVKWEKDRKSDRAGRLKVETHIQSYEITHIDQRTTARRPIETQGALDKILVIG